MHDHLTLFTLAVIPSLGFLALIRQQLVPSRDSSAFTRPLRALLFLPIHCHRHLLRSGSPSPGYISLRSPVSTTMLRREQRKARTGKQLIPVHDIFHQMLPL